MTAKQSRSLIRWFGSIAAELGLSERQINVHVGPTETASDGSPSIAHVEGVFGRQISHVTIDPSFLEESPEEQRYIVVHELIHVHTDVIRDLLRTALPKGMGDDAFDVFWPAFTLQDELMTDGLARAIAPMLPLWEG